MSSSSFKGNLTVGGSALDKSKLQLRRPTPDSDVLASSDDDKEHGRPPIRPPFAGTRRLSSTGWSHQVGSLRKNSLPSTSLTDTLSPSNSFEQARPVTSGFSWSTNSFGPGQSGSRLKDIVPSPTSALSPGDRPQPSPTSSEIDPGIHFLLNQQQPPPRKSVRSQSYSIGQGDIENSPVGKFSAHLRTNLRHKPSKPSMLGDSLAQLREDEADETRSNGSEHHGVRLPVGYWEREQQQTLLKQAVVARNRATSASSPHSQHRRKTTAGLRNSSYGADYAIDELDDDAEPSLEHPGNLTRRFSEQVSLFPREPEIDIMSNSKKPQWATNNIPMLGADAMGRRHSFAHYGSVAQNFAQSTLSNTQEEDEELESDPVSPQQRSHSPEPAFDASAYFAGYGPASRAINASAISAAHPDPVVPNASMSTSTGNPYAVPPVLGRPGRRLFVVTFKCSRADIYYLYDNTGLEIRRGDLVIVEGDRGCDLGQVTHADISLEEARKQKAAANEEHFRWLVMFSQYSLAGTTNDSGMLGSLARANGLPNAMAGPGTNTVGNPDQDAKPKMIKRLAQQHEIMELRNKEGSEAKAKRLGAQKAADHKLPMEILDAEYQADYHKLTYYYYADAYVNFNELVTDLFKQYKVRIWMSAVNPASVVNPAGMMQVQPPSAIGPGAILHSNAGRSQGVGYGFGNNNRGNPHYGRGRQQPTQGHGRGQGNYDDGYNAFSYQLPNYNTQTGYNAQGSYGLPSWAAPSQQSMFIPPGQYPNATGSSPMNYNGFYPPSTYGASSSSNAYGAPSSSNAYGASSSSNAYGASSSNAYRGGFAANSAAGASQPSTTTAGSTFGQYGAQSYNSPNPGTPSGYANPTGPATTSAAPSTGPSYNPTLDSALLTSLQNLGIGK